MIKCHFKINLNILFKSSLQKTNTEIFKENSEVLSIILFHFNEYILQNSIEISKENIIQNLKNFFNDKDFFSNRGYSILNSLKSKADAVLIEENSEDICNICKCFELEFRKIKE